MKYFFANWKMYHTHQESIDLIDEVSKLEVTADVTAAYFPNDLALEYAVNKLGGEHVGTQDVSWASEGANTGEISAHVYKEIGVNYALVGHSEQRHKFGETNQEVRKKLEACLASNLMPILCVGETKQEQEAGNTHEVLSEQISSALQDINLNNTELFIAYEPVWAIGTGTPCSADQAREVIRWIRQEVATYGITTVHVLYGGSVNSDNMLSYFSSDNIDGLLVGKASSNINTLNQMLIALNN